MAYTFKQPIKARQLANGKPLANSSHLAPGTHILGYDEVDQALFNAESLANNIQWCETNVTFPGDPSGVHSTLLQLRGQDIPVWPEVPRGDPLSAMPYKMALGTLQLGNGTAPYVFGGPRSTQVDGQLKWCIANDTQLPALSIRYKKKVNGVNIAHRVLLHGNTGIESVSYISPEEISSGRLAALNIAIPHSHLEASKEGNLFALTMRFGLSSKDQRVNNCVTVLHGKSDKEETDRWSDNAAMDQVMFAGAPRPDEKDFDVAILALLTRQNFTLTVFREVRRKDAAVGYKPRFALEFSSWIEIMKLAIQHGPFWWYRSQPGFNAKITGAHLTHWRKANFPPPVPFWLVTKFRAIVTQAGVTELMPIEFETLVHNPETCVLVDWQLPCQDIATFFQELHILREKGWQRTAGIVMFDDKRQPMTVVKLGEPSGPEQKTVFFRVDITARASIVEGTQTKGGEKILPDAGSAVAITFFFGVNKLSIKGRVVDELNKAENVDLVVHCGVSRRDANVFIKNTTLTSQVHRVLSGEGTIVVTNDYKSSDRQIAAFEGVGCNTFPENHRPQASGPQPRAILLEYPAKLAPRAINTASVMAMMAEFRTTHGIVDTSFAALCSWFGFPRLNRSQLNSIMGAIVGNAAELTIIHGPPGTGKSYTLACLVVLLVHVFEIKVAVTAPSNTACDAILDKIIAANRHLATRKLRMKMVRFLTLAGTPVGGTAAANVPVGEEGFALDEGLDELALRRRADWKTSCAAAFYSFHEAKLRFAQRHQEDISETKDMQNACHLWLLEIERVILGNIVGEAEKQWSEADGMIARRVLSEADILVGTLNSMGRKELADNACNIDTLIVDECAQSALGDIAIPFDTFQETLRRAVFGGDDYQLPSFVGSIKANEVALYTSRSLFKRLRQSPGNHSVWLLNVQYRCHPDIYHWSNSQFYEGLVAAGPNNSTVTPNVSHFRAFLETYVPNARTLAKLLRPKGDCVRLICIDSNAPSWPYPDSVSSYNPCDTAFSVWLTQAFQATGKTLLSPYRGQVQAWRDEWRTSGNPVPRITTVAQSQGGECEVGITCMVKNNPLRPDSLGFITAAELLNVGLTRQKEVHVLIGSFSPRYKMRQILFQMGAKIRPFIGLLEHIVEQKAGCVMLTPDDFEWPGYGTLGQPPKPDDSDEFIGQRRNLRDAGVGDQDHDESAKRKRADSNYRVGAGARAGSSVGGHRAAGRGQARGNAGRGIGRGRGRGRGRDRAPGKK